MELDKMTVKELKTLAEEKGVEVPNGAKKDEIIRLLTEEPETVTEAPQADEEPETTVETHQTNEKPETTVEVKRGQQDEKPSYRAYVGPTIPGGLLTTGKILYGTEAATNAYLDPVLKKYPTAKQLIVPMKELEKGMRDVKNPKKLLYHTAQKLIAEMKNGG